MQTIVSVFVSLLAYILFSGNNAPQTGGQTVNATEIGGQNGQLPVPPPK